MGKLINMFSTGEIANITYTPEMVNDLIPALRRLTEEAMLETNHILLRASYVSNGSPQWKQYEEDFDEAVYQWVDKVRRIGGDAKDMWTVDFDTGKDYLCWSYPETTVEHYHSYTAGFRGRKKLSGLMHQKPEGRATEADKPA